MTDELANLEEPEFNPATMPASTLMATRASRLKRPWVLLTLGIALVIAISVITDFPRPITKAQDAGDQIATMKAINVDLAPCVFALQESLRFHVEDLKGQLTKSDLNQIPGLLAGDRTACSFASEPVYDLTNNIQVTDTTAGIHIDHLKNLVTLWVTGHGLRAVDDVSTLFTEPNNQRISRDLAKQVTELNMERQKARTYVKEATKVLGIKIAEPKLPVLRALDN